MTVMEKMLCTIYKGSREQALYVYVPFENGIQNIPLDLQQRMGTITEVMTLEIGPQRKLARAKAETVLENIRDKGYYLQLPPTITGQVLFDGD